ncbi:rhodanese-like domain-containing protein [Profundibacter sp.]|uniref:rhodanese-like domain-containing protein n=1 Tax=Profundibacter sp. TaxID=3101071 RepID=UPI003D141B5D
MFISKQTLFAAVVALSTLPFLAHAGEIPTKKQTDLGLYVTAVEAADMLQDPNVVLVDVRSRVEVAFVGIPKRANVNIPYKIMPGFAEFNPEKGTYSMVPNPDFANVFDEYAQENGISRDRKIILICRSGSRSARAANVLAKLGYTNVYSLVDGFEGDKAAEGPQRGQRVVNGWKNAGLEWSYKLSETQVYPEDR